MRYTSGRTRPDAAILGVADALATRGVFGLVWCGADLVVRRCYGELAAFAVAGEPIGFAMPALMGLEGDILALRGAPGRSLTVPAVTLVTAEGPGPRLDLTVLWHSRQRAFVVLVARAEARPDLATDLAREVRRRLMAEAEAQSRSRDLARANRDLEAFASIVSHDLTAPLRAIRYFADDVEAALAADDPAAAGRHLSALRQQSRRMSTMLTALLEYSRAGYKRAAVERVDTGPLVSTLAASLQGRGAIQIVIDGDWPVLETVAAPLDLVLRNLVQNAIEHHDRPEGLVRVTGIAHAEMLEIVVADDGPGIAPEHQAAAFLPFRTLGNANKPERTGMGLALVQRTIEAVGARLALDSDPDRQRGTTFRIHWPRTITT